MANAPPSKAMNAPIPPSTTTATIAVASPRLTRLRARKLTTGSNEMAISQDSSSRNRNPASISHAHLMRASRSTAAMIRTRVRRRSRESRAIITGADP